jgi:hypothetical protein
MLAETYHVKHHPEIPPVRYPPVAVERPAMTRAVAALPVLACFVLSLTPATALTQSVEPILKAATRVPAQMEEYYKAASSADEIVATATYSKVRRFQVSTDEKLAKPPGR